MKSVGVALAALLLLQVAVAVDIPINLSYEDETGGEPDASYRFRSSVADYSGGVSSESSASVATSAASSASSSAGTSSYQGAVSGGASSESSSPLSSSSSDFDLSNTTGLCWKWNAHHAAESRDRDPREGHFMWLDSDRKTVYLYGGCGAGNHLPNCASTLEVLDLQSRTWIDRSIECDQCLSLQSIGAAYARHPSSSRIYEFGGLRSDASGERTVSNLIAELFQKDNTGEWKWARPEVRGDTPPGLQDASLIAVGSPNPLLVLFGGFNDLGASNKLYVVPTSGDTKWVWTQPLIDGSAPAPRFGMSGIRVGFNIFYFGGTNGVTVFNDLQVLRIPQGNFLTDVWKWQILQPTGASFAPAPRAFHVSLLVPDNRIIFYGGVHSTQQIYYNDTLIYSIDLNAWLAPPPSLAAGPDAQPRKKAAAVLVGNNDHVLISGGCQHHSCHDIYTPRTLDLKAVCPGLCKNGDYVVADNKQASCKCAAQFGGKFCDRESICPNKCNGRGTCSGGKCQCDLGWGGEDCSRPVCPNGCSGARGTCSDSERRCICNPGYWGLDCSQDLCPGNCNGRGICQPKNSNGTGVNFCACKQGFSGDACQYFGVTAPMRFTEVRTHSKAHAKAHAKAHSKAHAHAHAEDAPTNATSSSSGSSQDTYVQDFMCPNNCMGHGFCQRQVINGVVLGKCSCIDGFAGLDCSGECTLHCVDSAHGACTGVDPATVKCACNTGYKGVGCFEKFCANNCTGHGKCFENGCLCDSPWSGGACERDTTCTGHGKFDKGQCVCDAGYGGINCERTVTCASSCVNGDCVGAPLPPNADPQSPIVAICRCKDGWGGDLCDRQECPNKNCGGNGMCRSNGKCECFSGFTGNGCERTLSCPNNCTSTHGVCAVDPDAPLSDNGKCVCAPQWSGPACDDLGCPFDCYHRGKCIEGKCMCDDGYSGKSCEIMCPNKCNSNGACIAGSCKCYPGYDGLDCSEARQCKDGCNGHGVCFNATGRCFCEPGWSGDNCDNKYECGEAGCSLNGICRNSRCYCNPGYEGDHCERRSACMNDCSGRGVCMNGKCFCNTGFNGTSCESVVDDPTCPKNCSGNGVCQYGRCYCVEGYGGVDCSETRGEDKCRRFPDSKFVCEHRGICRFSQCFCSPGYAGDYCEKEEQCKGGCAKDQGICLMGKCHCLPGFKGPDCSEDMVCEGSPLPCSGHGVCIQGGCACLPGYTGSACEKTSINADTPCPKNCTDGGVCHMGRCFCVEGRDGPDCSIKTQDACPQACNHRGLCRFGQCFCKPGFVGRACEKEVQCSQKCLRNGVCAYGHCFCVAGFTGQDCDVPLDEDERIRLLEIDIADAVAASLASAAKSNDSSYCQGGCGNHGVCINNKCACEAGFYGANCHMVRVGPVASRCANNCSSHGQCLFNKCFCEGGWGGETCDKQVPMGCPQNCNGKGICNFGTCYCDPGFQGRTCNKVSTCDPDCEDSGHGVCVNGLCKCVPGWYGLNCNKTNVFKKVSFRELESSATLLRSSECPVSCGEFGVCVNKQCYCQAGYSGADCSQHESPTSIGAPAHLAVAAAAVTGAEEGSSMSYILLAVLSFASGVLACFIGQIVYDKIKENRRKQVTKDILKPLLHTLDQ